METAKKKKVGIIGAAVLAGSLLFCSGITVGAATNEPGGASDPLITKSYLEKQLQGVRGGYECITLSKGETLELAQGAQVILYTGTAVVVGSLIDTTEGSLAANGTKAVRYHMYLSPADKSGFTANATCVIFLSGEMF